MNDINKTLTIRQQKIIIISALTAKADILKMTIAFQEGLDAGLTINEINEELAHLYAYCGFEASVRGTNVFKEVVAARAANGINDQQGRAATPISETKNKYQRGEDAQVMVTGMSAEQLRAAFSFNPILDVFLKEHLFADIFGSDVLSYTDRELVTVSALVTMQEPLVEPHFGGALNVGISEQQLRELLMIIETMIGPEEAEKGKLIFEKVLKARNID